MSRMSLKQKKFADEYIETGNIFQSAIFAGYSENYAKTNAVKLLEKDSIKAYIDARLTELESKTIMSQREALELLTSIARGEIKEPSLMFVGEGVQEVVELPTHPNTRQKATESLLKRYDVRNKEELELIKKELEIEKLRQEVQNERSTEDKLENYLNALGQEITKE